MDFSIKKSYIIGMILMGMFPLISFANKVDIIIDCIKDNKNKLLFKCIANISGNENYTNNIQKVTISSTMPSMPMAHNIPDVEAVVRDKKFEFELPLEMYGNWLLTVKTDNGALIYKKIFFN